MGLIHFPTDFLNTTQSLMISMLNEDSSGLDNVTLLVYVDYRPVQFKGTLIHVHEDLITSRHC